MMHRMKNTLEGDFMVGMPELFVGLGHLFAMDCELGTPCVGP